MIVVDASALVAIADDEPEADDLLAIIVRQDAVMAGVNYVETGLILFGRRRMAGRADLDAWLRQLGVAVHTEDNLAGDALAAYLRFGRGFHAARLNLGDCFAYALAQRLDAALLYKGDYFTLTDVRAAT